MAFIQRLENGEVNLSKIWLGQNNNLSLDLAKRNLTYTKIKLRSIKEGKNSKVSWVLLSLISTVSVNMMMNLYIVHE